MASIAGGHLPAWTRDTFAGDGSGRGRGSAERSRRQPCVRCCSPTPSPNLGSGDRRGRDRRARGRRDRHAARAARVLRTAADLAGLLCRSTEARALNVNALYDVADRGDAIVFVEPSCLSAIREDAARLLREPQRRAQVIAGASVLFEEYLERECRRRTRAAAAAVGTGDGAAAPALPSTIDGPGGEPRGRCCREFPARRSPISTPAAAAWPARSATPATITRCRGRSASGSCCPPRARCDQATSSSPPARHAATRWPTSRGSGGAPCRIVAVALRGASMNLAWISLAALIVAITLSMVRA